ncbi:MAG TPA: hypothetical protein H9810_01125 [Candidatus Gemmiger excrementavium]|uniref:Uncharacterized protein n=1 Tax=Candidatus Gemmiger excrementavium TaxID=2838608 RepID=A0A9D2F0D9_9FIRM|nr:hypothetical protein [Candidatus Gemmiger excrementavium]
MAQSRIDIPLDGVGEPERSRRSRIDIPLKEDGDTGAAFITDKELEFVSRHHQAYVEQRRRARRQGGQ